MALVHMAGAKHVLRVSFWGCAYVSLQIQSQVWPQFIHSYFRTISAGSWLGPASSGFPHSALWPALKMCWEMQSSPFPVAVSFSRHPFGHEENGSVLAGHKTDGNTLWETHLDNISVHQVLLYSSSWCAACLPDALSWHQDWAFLSHWHPNSHKRKGKGQCQLNCCKHRYRIGSLAGFSFNCWVMKF